MFKSVKEEAVGEITEKKSKFICHIYPIESQEEAEEKLNSIRKQYHDARHNCFAYKVFDPALDRASDDGEPSGTAGAPMLAILNGNNLNNCLAVVTRYFGGILLGTGGLVKAYSEALNEAIRNAQIVEKELGLEASFNIDYSCLEELKYILKNMEILITNQEFGEKILVTVLGPKEKIENLQDNTFFERVKIENFKLGKNKFYNL